MLPANTLTKQTQRGERERARESKMIRRERVFGRPHKPFT